MREQNGYIHEPCQLALSDIVSREEAATRTHLMQSGALAYLITIAATDGARSPHGIINRGGTPARGPT